MMIAGFAERQIRATSLTVVLTFFMNLVIPGYAAAGGPTFSIKSTEPILLSDLNGFDACKLESDGSQMVTYDPRDNSKPGSDSFDDFVLSGVVFSSVRGIYFGPISTKVYSGRNPAPENRPPNPA